MSADRLLTPYPLPVIGFCAASGTGKTTLLRYVIGEFVSRDPPWRVGVIKQARDDFDVDHPGKDSERLRRAGVDRLILGSERHSVLIVENPLASRSRRDPELDDLVAELDLDTLDLILVEGFSDAAIPKIELIRDDPLRSTEPTRRYRDDPWIIAIATDRPDTLETALPVFDIDDPWSICDFIRRAIEPQTTGGRTPCH